MPRCVSTWLLSCQALVTFPGGKVLFVLFFEDFEFEIIRRPLKAPPPKQTAPETQTRPWCERFPDSGPDSISWETPLTDIPETPYLWKPPQRRREGWLEGCCEWGDVTAPAPESLLQRQRGRKRERGERRNREEERQGEAAAAAAAAAGDSLGFVPTCSCANSSPVCQASVRGAERNVHSCGSERMKGRKWKNPIAPDVDADCGSSRLY